MILLLPFLSLLGFLALPGPPDKLPPGIMAQGAGIEITEIRYYDYLTDVYFREEIGASLLEQLIREEAIAQEAKKRNVAVSHKELERKVQDLEAQIRIQSDDEKGLNDYLQEEGVHENDFFEALRLSMAHDIMARRDFGIGRNEEMPVEKLNIWLKDLLGKSRIELEDLEEGSMARVNDAEITRSFFGKRLSTLIKPTKASAMLTELIGIQLIRQEADEMGITLEKADADREIVQRESFLKEKAGLENVTYESYLHAATGQTLEELRASEKFQGEVLLKKICESLHHEAYLQDFFDNHRTYFYRKYGRAARLSTIFLRAVIFPNQFVNRKFEEAEEELAALKERLERGEVAYEDMARIYSEHDSKSAGGDLGFIAPGTPGWEEVVETALLVKKGTLLDPFRTEAGCHLIKVCGHRDNPAYESIRDDVAHEARQHYYDSLMNKAKVQRKF
ncbi:MAG: peptidylprolyl isomerase [Planctomycetota bacterium]|jgi:parvulin-like peptidyl-prolyl isomerase